MTTLTLFVVLKRWFQECVVCGRWRGLQHSILASVSKIIIALNTIQWLTIWQLLLCPCHLQTSSPPKTRKPTTDLFQNPHWDGLFPIRFIFFAFQLLLVIHYLSMRKWLFWPTRLLGVDYWAGRFILKIPNTPCSRQAMDQFRSRMDYKLVSIYQTSRPLNA